MSTIKQIKTIELSGTKNGTINVVKIDEPYGKDSHPVASIAISVKGDIENPEWKVHIPLENVQEVIKALQNID